MNAFKLALYWGIAKQVYQYILRRILLNAVDDPEKEWDDVLMAVIDSFFAVDSLGSDELWEMVKKTYADTLRPIAKDYVDKTETPYDNWMLMICDKIFGYQG